jgi:hypothetical protein
MNFTTTIRAYLSNFRLPATPPRRYKVTRSKPHRIRRELLRGVLSQLKRTPNAF